MRGSKIKQNEMKMGGVGINEEIIWIYFDSNGVNSQTNCMYAVKGQETYKGKINDCKSLGHYKFNTY